MVRGFVRQEPGDAGIEPWFNGSELEQKCLT